MNRALVFAAFGLAMSAAGAAPPSEMPSEMPSEQPAATPQPAPRSAPAPAPSEQPAAGTENVVKSRGATIIGDDETPLGLYIMPWRNSAAAAGLDRPARMMDDALLPLDPEVFHRQVQYNQALAAQLRRERRITPERTLPQ
jgi:hypothetical protein